MEFKIEDIKIGIGREIKKGALCFVHYTGYLENGAKFESSLDDEIPFKFVFGTGRVIKGWDQGLVGMKVGGKRKLYIPSQLAYGERAVGAKIKPHSNLIFIIELLEVRLRED
jgi:peptidylprolyl isomerase